MIHSLATSALLLLFIAHCMIVLYMATINSQMRTSAFVLLYVTLLSVGVGMMFGGGL